MALHYSTDSNALSNYVAVWGCWVDETTYTTTASTTVWGSWAGTSTASCSSDTVWIRWYDCQNKDSFKSHVYGDFIPLSETEEHKKERLEKERIAAEKYAAAVKKQREEEKEREQKAWAFLVAVLNEKQKKQMEKDKFFELISVKSGTRYRIRKGQTRNIEKLDGEGKVIQKLCVHPVDYLHDYDAMAMQKLALEYDEEATVKIANVS